MFLEKLGMLERLGGRSEGVGSSGLYTPSSLEIRAQGILSCAILFLGPFTPCCWWQ